MNFRALSSCFSSFELTSLPYIKSKGTLGKYPKMSQKVNTEWRNVRLNCKHVVHRVSVHPNDTERRD
jgi:hypothetical protein